LVNDKTVTEASAKLPELTERLKKTFGEKLVSVVLYGSAASEDWNRSFSDLNVLCVLQQISPQELRASQPILHWWRAAGNPPPLLLTAEEVQSSTDCFPMEFRDMQQYRRVLFGADVIENLVVDHKFYRAQVEHELRAKQLRLRQRAAEVLSEPDRLHRLMADSVSTFCVLGRHALILDGQAAVWSKREIVAALEKTIGYALTGFGDLLAARADPKVKLQGAGSVALLDRYLMDVAALVHFVDKLGTHS
jgi:hypothetical protein